MSLKSNIIKKTISTSESFLYPWQDSVSSLPSLPGVYWFTDEKGDVIYVGKAKNLRNRVLSYTRVTPQIQRTYKMVNTAVSLKFEILNSNLEAILIEAQLIKNYQPRFNVDLKDDKSPLYIVITKDEFPRVITARKKQLATIFQDIPQNNIFGPFHSSKTARDIIKIARKIFKFCNSAYKNEKSPKACFYTHINLCSGACIGKVSKEEYSQSIKRVKTFLNGKRMKLIKQLQNDMIDFSNTQKFEQAAILRDQIQSLEKYFEFSKILEFDPDLPLLSDDIYENTSSQLVQILHTAGLVPLGYKINRIEAYDISNTQGNESTASMVVFENGKPANHEYRKFRIKYTTGPNDPAMLKEALARRLNHPEWSYPDLIVIDGGKGQLRAARSVIEDKIPTISLVKNPDRLLIPQDVDEKTFYYPYKLQIGKPVSKMLAHLRDEAHRFAKKYHTHLRSRSVILKG